MSQPLLFPNETTQDSSFLPLKGGSFMPPYVDQTKKRKSRRRKIERGHAHEKSHVFSQLVSAMPYVVTRKSLKADRIH